MKPSSFRVIGDPVGYTRLTQRGRFTARAKKYHAYMVAVQVEARKAGLRLPLVATEVDHLRVDVYCTFSSRRHSDPENVRKGIIDALFYGGKGDKYCYGYHAAPRYGINPQVLVMIGAEEILY